MAQPLAVCLAFILAFQASAQWLHKPEKVLRAEMADGFAKGIDVSSLDVSEQNAEFVALFNQVKRIQAGKDSQTEKETFITSIRSVARRLEVNQQAAVDLYLKRPPRTSALTAADVAADKGIRQDVQRNRGLSQAKRRRVARDLQTTAAYLNVRPEDDYSRRGLTRDSKGNLAFTVASPDAISVQAVLPMTLRQRTVGQNLPRAQPVSMNLQPVPAPRAGPTPSASNGMMSWAAAIPLFDWDLGRKVAENVYQGTLRYVAGATHRCAQFAREAREKAAGILFGSLRTAHAADFITRAKAEPKALDRMGLREVDLAHISDDASVIAPGSKLVFARSCAGYSATSGHTEETVSAAVYVNMRARDSRLKVIDTAPNEVRVCSFYCGKHTTAYLRTYAKQGCLHMYVPVKSS